MQVKYFSNAEVSSFVSVFEKELLKSKRYKINFSSQWAIEFKPVAGVYIIFDNDKLVYIGETANLYKRMKELGRTYNHSFRKKLGCKLQPDAKIEKGKYSLELETLLTDYCNNNIYVASLPLAFGRLEVESYLIHKHHLTGLLNSLGKRNAIPKE